VRLNAAPPATALVGEIEVIVGTGLLMLNAVGPLLPPPGAGVTTDTGLGPADAIAPAGMLAVSWVLLTNVVGMFTPKTPNCTTEVVTKFVPFTVRVNAAPPAVANVGESEVIVGRLARLVSENAAGAATPGTVAFTTYAPFVKLAVKLGAVAEPVASVVAVPVATPPANVPLAPVLGAVQVTRTPCTALLPASVTLTVSGAKEELTGRLCGVPEVAAMLAAGPPVLVSEKFTVVRPAAAAVTVYGPPAVAFAVKGADATPDAFVATTIVAVALLNLPDAPAPGAVNVTFTPGTGLLPASFTVTASAMAKAVLIVADCGVVPAFAVIDVAAPAVLVSEKFTVVSPAEAAVTV
jgi:hypothetical protein